jgi:uncharacterized RDD family membrane protein YckC
MQTKSTAPNRVLARRRKRRDAGNLSGVNKTSKQFPSWKQEVNERVAAHLHRKTPPADEAGASRESRPAPVGRAAQAAAQAAARVAARYANAPSYNEMLAEEARAAVRAAQAASRAALEAHAAAQSILDGLEAASEEAQWQQEETEATIHAQTGHAQTGETASTASPQSPPEGLRFDETAPFNSSHGAEMRQHPAEKAPTRASFRQSRPSIFEAHAATEKEPAWTAPSEEDARAVFSNEAAQPIYANLIEFPREMVAARKVRPRRIEGPLAGEEPGLQLSIFEVDPGAVSSQPAVPVSNEPAAPTWMRPEWPAFELEEQPREDFVEKSALQARQRLSIALAPLSRRLLAIVVDISLVSAAFALVAMRAAHFASRFHNPRAAAVIGVLATLIIGAAYLTLFFTLAKSTPGMWYGGIALSTLNGDSPTRAQRYRRLMALPLSVLPLGLGLAWALFDECNLTWHDRLSGTYLRRR